MTDTDPTCARCGHKRSQHNYRHPFVGPSMQATIDAQAARIAELEMQQDADMRDLIKAEVVAQIQRQARAEALHEALGMVPMHWTSGDAIRDKILRLIDKEPTA